ncbi:SDR family oxidoreductase [Noviherbaspirillum massiliense]|uniref:SDR family oxidoreductase n=1 Tax=Noviherbaspirillum massiliense TaxID=1465823 RepID=UPI0002DAAAD1|nr:SDR family oxidoreductase [Noviherbaspirillum massiliense]
MILLTGASGTIGRATLDALKASGQRFKVATRSPKKIAEGIESVKFDWDDLDTYLPAMQGVDKLFLLTPNIERQVGYVLQAVAAARRAGVKHIVRLSVMGTDADPGIILARQHHAAERELKASGIAWTMLRPTFFMQNFINYYGADPERDSQVYLPHGSGKAAWVDAVDVGQVAAKVLAGSGYEGRVFELTGPQALSTEEALKILGTELGHSYTYVDVPEATVREAMENASMPLWLVDGFMELHAMVKHGHSESLAGGVEEVLGRKPHSLQQWAKGLRQTVAST